MNEHLEELAALHAVGLLDEAERKELRTASESDPSVLRLIEACEESAALLAYAAPQVEPPPILKRELLRELPRRRAESRIISFPQWIPYALAACLTALVIYQANQNFGLKHQAEVAQAQAVALQQRNDLVELRLAFLETKNPVYGSAKVMVAWDPQRHHGVISLENLPAPPPGHDYQLWILDPTPVSAGLLTKKSGSEGFAAHSANTSGPGFAISLEPSGGRPSPTGPILFASAPGP